MRQRITFLQEAVDSVNPELLKMSGNAITTKALKAAREDRITFGFDELPQHLKTVFNKSHELHIRWARETPYNGLGPLVGRISPGLHVFYTPQRVSKGTQLDFICRVLLKTFGNIDCESPENSFTKLPTERFSHSTATEYYSPLSSLDTLIDYTTKTLCKESDSECVARISLLTSAASLDIDFDSISHVLKVTAFWPSQLWDLNLRRNNPREKLEVGILSVAPPREPEELSLGGFLTVVGEDTKPSPTLFSFPSRHHQVPQKFSSKFVIPTGLHPALELRVGNDQPPTEDKACSLHAHLTLPRSIFADKYQLSDPLFLASKNLSAIHYITTPVDLEAPEYATKIWGSSVLLELAPPFSSREWTAQVPLHLRYLMPNAGKNGQEPIDVPYPVVFWACTADEGSKFPINPFDKVNLGYDGLFGPKTMFYHLTPEVDRSANSQGRLVNTISVPVLDLDRSWYVESGTTVAVFFGFAWVCWRLVRVWTRQGYGSNTVSVKGTKKKQ